MASTSKADPAMAAAAAAALEAETSGHGHGHHRAHQHRAVANRLLHHGQHATITITADSTTQPPAEPAPPTTSAAGSGKGSPFASLDGQTKTAAAVLGDAGLAVAGVPKPEAAPASGTTAVVPAGWPASGKSPQVRHHVCLAKEPFEAAWDAVGTHAHCHSMWWSPPVSDCCSSKCACRCTCRCMFEGLSSGCRACCLGSVLWHDGPALGLRRLVRAGLRLRLICVRR